MADLQENERRSWMITSGYHVWHEDGDHVYVMADVNGPQQKEPIEVVPRADAEALQVEVDQLRAAIDTALRTTWVEDDEGGWGTEEDRIYADRLSALAALQPHWQEWGDAAYHLAGADLERRQIAERFAEALAEALQTILDMGCPLDRSGDLLGEAQKTASSGLAAYRAKHPASAGSEWVCGICGALESAGGCEHGFELNYAEHPKDPS